MRRVALVSLHTSPLRSPGTGDAGGLNVYVAQTALALARRGVEVDVLTRRTADGPRGPVALAPGLPATVHHLPAGPPGATKDELPAHLAEFSAALEDHLRTRPAQVAHTHYWLSGAATLPVAQARSIPLVHTMHTMARVKNAALAPGDRSEPEVRVEGEDRLVAGAAALVASAAGEARDLVELCGADPARVHVVHPGVDLDLFRPGDRAAARERLGLAPDAVVLLLVGRVQPLKAPDLLVRAAAELVRRDPALRPRLRVVVLGGLSGTGLDRPALLDDAVAATGLEDVVLAGPPVPREELVGWFHAADLLVVPSYAESFGLVAVEALASGTPVVAARVGGLPVAVGEAGVLVDGHEDGAWADALGGALARLAVPGEREAWAAQGLAHARGLSWERTVDGLVAVYAEVLA